MQFPKTHGWLDWFDSPTKPNFQLPSAAVDAHCHVFRPSDVFASAPQRRYTPCGASKEQLVALRDQLDFDKNVILQPTCHDSDNRALVDALKAYNNKARGVASVSRNVTDAEPQDMHAAAEQLQPSDVAVAACTTEKNDGFLATCWLPAFRHAARWASSLTLACAM